MRTVDEMEATGRDGSFSRFDMAVMLPYLLDLKPGDTYLEVGVQYGRSLEFAREVADDKVNIVGIDLDELKEPVPGAVFVQANSRTWKHNGKVELIFIDGDHNYEGVKADIENWYPQMAEGGVMLFHDCDETSPGVVKAFDEFVAANKPKKAWKDSNPRCGMAVIEL